MDAASSEIQASDAGVVDEPVVSRPVGRSVKRRFTGFDLFSVFKFGSAFYLALAAAWLLGSMFLFLAASATGLAGSIEGFIQASGFPEFQLTWLDVLKVLALTGVLSALVLSALTVLSAYLFNRVADLFGGIEMRFIQDDPELEAPERE